MEQVEQDYWICEICEEEDEEVTCKCGRECHKDDLCGHGIAIGLCCNCEVCESEWSDDSNDESD